MDSPDLAAGKRLLDAAKVQDFIFHRVAPGPDGPLWGVRDSAEHRDEIYLAVLPLHGRGRRRRPDYDPWRDAAGMSIPPAARVEQVLVDRAHGALTFRLGKQAQVIRRSRGSRLVVRFDGETQSVSIRPELVRVRPVNTGQILDQLQQLHDLLPAGGHGDGR